MSEIRANIDVPEAQQTNDSLSELVDTIAQANRTIAKNTEDESATKIKATAMIDALNRRNSGDKRIRVGFKYGVTSPEYTVGKPQMVIMEIEADPEVKKPFYTETRLENLLSLKPQEEIATLIGTPDQISKRPPKRSISKRKTAA